MKNAPLPLAETERGPSLSLSFQLVFKVTGKAMQFPAYRIPPGMSVTLYTVNGGAVNANPSFISLYPEALGTSSGRICPAGADVSVPWNIDNLCELFASGTEGDGMLAVLQLAQVG
jgi:hypothetical protein